MNTTPQPDKKIIGYNCDICHGKNARESGDTIVHVCKGVLIPVFEETHIPKWEEEFDKEYPYMESASSSKGELIKDFIRTVIQQARDEQREADAKIAENKYKESCVPIFLVRDFRAHGLRIANEIRNKL